MPPAPTRILVRSACPGELGARRTRLPPSACCRRRRVCRKASPEDGFGPASPPEQPQWLKDLYKQAEDFPEEEYLQELLRDTGGDPAKIEANARRKLAESVGRESNPQAERQQHDLAQMHVRFSQVDPFNLWIWLEFYSEPSEAEQEMLSSVLDAWFILGRLGSFNTVNLQLSNSFEHSASFFEYDDSQLDTSLPAAFHEMEQPEFRGRNGRFWVNLGTCDEICLDLLINALHNFSNEYVSIRTLQIGGQSPGFGEEDEEDWQAPPRPSPFKQDAEEVKAVGQSIADDLSQIYDGQFGAEGAQ